MYSNKNRYLFTFYTVTLGRLVIQFKLFTSFKVKTHYNTEMFNPVGCFVLNIKSGFLTIYKKHAQYVRSSHNLISKPCSFKMLSTVCIL